MAEVLVLVDTPDGSVGRVALELVTAARGLGEPAVVLNGGSYDAVKERAG